MARYVDPSVGSERALDALEREARLIHEEEMAAREPEQWQPVPPGKLTRDFTPFGLPPNYNKPVT